MIDLLWIALAGVFIGVTWWQHRALLRSNRGIAEQAAEDAKSTAKSLSAIHTLVNSNLAAAKQGELDATRRDLASLQEVVSLKESQGLSVSPESLAVIIEVKERIAEMNAAAAHAEEQTEIADAQMERDRARE